LETLVINDATADPTWAGDPYIVAEKTRSLLCTPITNQGKLIGIIYLENNLMSGAFTRDRLEVLKFLCSQAAISLENARLYTQVAVTNEQLEQANEQLEDYSRTLEEKVVARTTELKAAQQQIIAQEKLASLGSLTSGIAHELRNPLNFVNNYAEGSLDLTNEVIAELEINGGTLEAQSRGYLKELLNDIKENSAIIKEHGQRAERIISSMMNHARSETKERRLSNLNGVLAEAINLVYQSKRASNLGFNVSFETEYDRDIGELELVPSALSRAFINILDNACYAVLKKRKQSQISGEEEEKPYQPILTIKTQNRTEAVEILIRDNGIGIPSEVREKIFNPFFTTKPTGEGTGLGLSLTYDIIVGQHGGSLKINSEPGLYTEFMMMLPKKS
ncbi:MAG: GAF domain-containing protein, partial [Okeania sp. SIO2D1]|nr:GAF domain-containing protein [Okeania sp. SIO2D1]